MAVSDSELDKKMESLRHTYAGSLPAKVGNLRAQWSSLENVWSAGDAEELYRLVHSLSGSSGIHEATDLAGLARALEQSLLTIIYAERAPRKDEAMAIARLFADLGQEANNWAKKVLPELETKEPAETVQSSGKLVYLLDDNMPDSRDIETFLRREGIQTAVVATRDDLVAACGANQPDAIALSSNFASDETSVTDLISRLDSICQPLPRLFAIGDEDDFDARLAAARTGIYKYLFRPFDAAAFNKAVSELVTPTPEKSYRVLLVTDDTAAAQLHSNLLQQAGVQVDLVSDPTKALSALQSLQPDLVLVDVNKSGCNGLELATIIRQDELCTHLPIVILSSETGTEKKPSTFCPGGEELLLKPVDPKIFQQYILTKTEQSHWMQRARRDMAEALTENVYRKLALDQHAIVSTTDLDGRITSVNGKFCEISGYTEQELIGRNHRVVSSGFHTREFFENLWQTISSGNVWHGEICNRKKNNEVYWVASTIVPYLDRNGLPYQYISIRTDISKNKLLETQLSRHVDLIDALRDAMTQFMTEKGFHDVMESLLQELISITGSEYGFMGEVLREGGRLYLKIHATSNLAWSDEARHLYQKKSREGIELRDLDNLLGSSITSGEVVICNDVVRDTRGNGLPAGHPPLHNFLGIPVFLGSQLVGIYGVVNRNSDYTEELTEFLAPFGATYGVLIHSRRISEMEYEVTDFLDRARADAEKATSAKSEFLSSMSHELRTPLNVIMGFAQLMADAPAHELSESQKENAEEILRAGDHLLGLVNEVLDLARIESGHVDLQMTEVDIYTVIEDCISLVQPLAQKRFVQIHFQQATHERIYVTADITRLNQALLNYLANAVKYVRENGNVWVTCTRVLEGRMRVLVRDDGPGIAQENHNLIFLPFSRAGAENSGTEGAGIGLVITKRLLEEMHGSVGFESEQGKGATFWLELPIVEQIADTIRQPNRLAPETMATETAKHYQHTILYIEDNPANLNLITQAMKRRPNISLLTALEPQLGLEIARSTRLDAILLDINLPHMSGFEVMKQLQQHPFSRDVPIIAVSANAMPGDITNGIAAGFTEYVTKPIKLDVFFETIDRVLAKR